MSIIKLTNFVDAEDTYQLLYSWCCDKNVYEWFEQRILSYEEIVKKYKNKYLKGNQQLFLISYDDKPIGLVQIYKYNDFMFNELKGYKKIYEYDLFIGDSNYLHKGIGTKVIEIVNNYIYDNYQADCIVLRPFKRNQIAIRA